MTIKIDDNGTVYLHQGDSGDIVINGVEYDGGCKVYLAIKNSNRETVGYELVAIPDFNSKSVRFHLNASYTDLLVVPPEDDYAVYNYGIKVCSNDGMYEDTLVIKNKGFGSTNSVIVYPKLVEGTDGQ